MSSKIGALLVDMALNTAAFASDLSKSQNALNTWASSSNKTLAGVVNGYRGLSKEISSFTERTFTLRNAVMTLAGGGALGLLINKSIEAASAIVDTADNIGIATKTLQEYTYAGRLSSISTDQMQEALKKFATSMGQAHGQTGKFYTYLVNSNPELLKQVQAARSVDEALNSVFVAMGKMGNQTDRLALAQAAFSKTNLDMVNLVKDGVPAFEAMRQKANELGIVIADDLLRNAEDAGDKIDTLAQVFRAQLTMAVAENATEIGHFAEELTKLVPKVIWLATEAMNFVNVITDEWEPATIKLGVTFATMAINAQKAWLMAKDAATLGFTDAGERIKDLDEQARLVAEEAAARLDALKNKKNASPAGNANEAAAANRAAAAAADEYAAKQQKAADAAKEASKSFDKLKAAADRIKQDGQTPFQNYINDVAELDKMLKANLITWEEYGNAVKAAQEKNFHTTERVKRVLGDTQTAQEKYNATMEELNQLRGVQGGLSEEQYQQAVAKTSAELRKAQMEGSLFGDIMDKAIDGNIKSWRDLGKAVIDFGKTLLKNLINGQGIGNAFGGMGGGGLNIGSLFSGIGSFFGIGNLPWQQSGFSSLMSAFGFHSGGMVGGSTSGMSRRVSPGVFNGAPRFHSGGLVGGEVPIIAKKGERVLTEQQQKDGMGGTVVYHIDARGAAAGVEQQLRQMIMDLHQSVEPRAVKAVQSARARDPQLFNGAP